MATYHTYVKKDRKADVWYIQSSEIPGLTVEAKTLKKIVKVVDHHATDLMRDVFKQEKDYPMHAGNVEHKHEVIALRPNGTYKKRRAANLVPNLSNLA